MPNEQPRTWQTLLVSVLLLFLLVVSLVGLYILSIGFIGVAVLVGGGLFLIVGLHYIVWGWWLGPAIQREVELEEDDERPW